MPSQIICKAYPSLRSFPALDTFTSRQIVDIDRAVQHVFSPKNCHKIPAWRYLHCAYLGIFQNRFVSNRLSSVAGSDDLKRLSLRKVSCSQHMERIFQKRYNELSVWRKSNESCAPNWVAKPAFCGSFHVTTLQRELRKQSVVLEIPNLHDFNKLLGLRIRSFLPQSTFGDHEMFVWRYICRIWVVVQRVGPQLHLGRGVISKYQPRGNKQEADCACAECMREFHLNSGRKP